MRIELCHVADMGAYINLDLYVSSKDFEKLFNLTKENGRYLMIHAQKEKSIDGSYPYSAFIEGGIYDENGEICAVNNRMFEEDYIIAINKWIDENKELWMTKIKESSSSTTKETLWRYSFSDRGNHVYGIVKSNDERSAALTVAKGYNKHGVDIRACDINVRSISFDEDGVMEVAYYYQSLRITSVQ